jgi:AraC-like DNA-binding protein/mannose-6-phosphate isomerase-like protein (cupin superfamily)
MNRPAFDLDFPVFLRLSPNVELQFCFVSNCAKGVHVRTHTHQALELVYYVNGSGKSVIGKQVHEVHRHALAVIPANVPHDQRNLTGMTSICVGVSHSGLEQFQGTWRDVGGILGKLFMLLVEEIKNKKTGFESIAKGILLEIQGLTERLSEEALHPPQREALVSKAVEIIHRHEGALSVADIASRLYISKDYLRHLFSEYAGESPIKYILRVRLEKAQVLLVDKSLRIGEIATQCGFENAYYFSRFFRKITRQTPSDFRKHHGR